jgi:hypothetical protein
VDSSIISPPEDPTRSVPFPDPVASAPIASTTATHCANCGALLAADQRYCVECGERHGDPRLPVMSGRQDLSAPALAPPPPRKGGSRLARASANTALIAGVGTLLVALGVGVLIGRSSESSRPAAGAAPQVVTIAGGGAVAGGATAASSAAPASTGDASTPAATKDAKDAKAKAGGDKGKSDDPSSSADAPASGKAVPKKAGKVVSIGSKGSGKGYKDGKFTGDFFGG